MAVIFNISEALERSAFNVLQEPIKMLLEGEVEAFEKKSFLPSVFVFRTTDKYQEEYRSSTAMDGFKPTEDLQPAGLSDFDEGYGQIFRTQIWTNAFVVSKQAIEDNQALSINPKALGFIKSYGRTRERFGAAMISGALAGDVTFEGKKFTCKGMDTVDGTVDGVKQTYFHKEHQPLDGVAGGIEQSNMFYKKIDLAAVTAPEDLIKVVDIVETAMRNYRDYKGNILDIRPSRIVAPANKQISSLFYMAFGTPNLSLMGDNAINPHYNKWDVVITPYLSGLTGFEEKDQAFLMISPDTNRENLGAVWYDRTQLEISSWIDPQSKANVWDGRARYGVGFADFRAIAYVCTGENGTYVNSSTAL